MGYNQISDLGEIVGRTIRHITFKDSHLEFDCDDGCYTYEAVGD